MQTILGSSGQIGIELAKELHRKFTTDIRLVSRNPQKINATDQLFPADLLDLQAAEEAVEGSEIVYITVGVPLNTEMMENQYVKMVENCILACKKYQCKLVFFDNTYMYPKTDEPQTEESPFAPVGRKSVVRAKTATMVLNEIKNKDIDAVICRAPEFYGPDKTFSITNSLVFDAIAKGKKPRVPINDEVLRTLIWTPDAGRATAWIGNTPDAYNQTWHLPCDDNRLTYKEIIQLASEILQKELPYSVIKLWMFQLSSLFNRKNKELLELLPRYKYDNIFLSDKFKNRFPDFEITSYREGIAWILEERMGLS